MDPRRKVILVGVLLGIVAVALVLGSFATGFVLGYSRGSGEPVIAEVVDGISHQWFAGGLGGHGGLGSLVSIDDNALIVRGRDGTTTTVTVSDKTMIRRDRHPGKISDLQPGDSILVVGSPGSRRGTLDARLIRVVATPAPQY